jgi:hypothetical protein
MGAPVIRFGVPMSWEGWPRLSNGDPLTRRGTALCLDRCPPPREGCPRSTDGIIRHGRSVIPSRGGARPYRVMAVPIRHDRCPRSRKGCTPPAEADTRMGRRMQPYGVKDGPIPRSRTPIGPHGLGQAGTRTYPLACSPVPAQPDGHGQAGPRKYPFARCGYPWALMVTRKRREGWLARGKAPRPSGRVDSGK